MTGYGPVDISDRLRFRMFAQRAATSNSWTVIFQILNLTSNSVVMSKSYANCTAAASVDDGTAVWTDYNGNPGVPSLTVHQGVQMFFSPTNLINFPAFAGARDTDKDGMPNVWEIANGFNTNSAADATLDADSDALNNRAEYLAGTNPRLADTDDGTNLQDQKGANTPWLGNWHATGSDRPFSARPAIPGQRPSRRTSSETLPRLK